ncbi:MAG: AEC family transporter [Aquificae bacterium]|nr:AEC family transporter [Aquificota bacterium]
MLENLFSVILYFSLGYFSRKKGIFKEDASDILIKFIIYFSFPALVIYNIYHLKVDSSIFFIVFTGWAVVIFSIFLSFFVGKLLRFNKATHASFIMMATFGNTSFLGFPFQLAFFGEEGLRYAVIFDQLASFLPVSLLSPFILAYGQGSKTISIDWKKIITFPPFVTLVFAFLIKPFFSIPEFVLNALHTLGMTVIPLALFSVGFNLRFSAVRERLRDVLIVLFIKMIFVPFVVVLVLVFLGIEFTLPVKSTLLEIAMPPMVLASIFVIGAKLDKDLAVSSVGLGIIASFITVPIFVWIINHF